MPHPAKVVVVIAAATMVAASALRTAISHPPTLLELGATGGILAMMWSHAQTRAADSRLTTPERETA